MPRRPHALPQKGEGRACPVHPGCWLGRALPELAWPVVLLVGRLHVELHLLGKGWMEAWSLPCARRNMASFPPLKRPWQMNDSGGNC